MAGAAPAVTLHAGGMLVVSSGDRDVASASRYADRGGRRGAGLRPEGPEQPGGAPVGLPRAAQRAAGLLPARLHRHLPGRAVLGPGQPQRLRQRRRAGADRQRRLLADAQGLGRAGGLPVPAAGRLLAARGGGPGVRRLQRASAASPTGARSSSTRPASSGSPRSRRPGRPATRTPGARRSPPSEAARYAGRHQVRPRSILGA